MHTKQTLASPKLNKQPIELFQEVKAPSHRDFDIL